MFAECETWDNIEQRIHIFSVLQNDDTGSVSFYVSNYLDDNLWYRSLSQTKRKIFFFYHNIDTCDNKMQTKSHTNILSKRKLEDVEVSTNWYNEHWRCRIMEISVVGMLCRWCDDTMNHVNTMSLWRRLITMKKTLTNYVLHHVERTSVDGWRWDARSCSSRWEQEFTS